LVNIRRQPWLGRGGGWLADEVETATLSVTDARDLAEKVIGGLPDRWRHTAAVARRAQELFPAIGRHDREVLVAAAWLHDIGYGALAMRTGFHPLDGAMLLDEHHWPRRLGALVAHHSGACFVADAIGLGAPLRAYPQEKSAMADALTYADQTVGHRGERLTIDDRIADMLRRHGPDSPNARVHHIRGPHLLATAQRVEQRLPRAI
jgi:putative nucleotidyltransferase with HDIG domain